MPELRSSNWTLPLSAAVSEMAASTISTSSEVESPDGTSRLLTACSRATSARLAARSLHRIAYMELSTAAARCRAIESPSGWRALTWIRAMVGPDRSDLLAAGGAFAAVAADSLDASGALTRCCAGLDSPDLVVVR